MTPVKKSAKVLIASIIATVAIGGTTGASASAGAPKPSTRTCIACLAEAPYGTGAGVQSAFFGRGVRW